MIVCGSYPAAALRHIPSLPFHLSQPPVNQYAIQFPQLTDPLIKIS